MKYMTTKEAGLKWDISDRRIRILLNDNSIERAIKVGRNWSIPNNATKPIGLRKKSESDFLGLDIDFSKIDQLKNTIDLKRPLDKITSQSLREKLIIDWTYNSNAIEGNTLTLLETKVVLEGITIGGKSVIEHLEAINHKKAILFLEDLVQSNNKLSEWDIKNIHAIILKNINHNFGGKYRMSNVVISGAQHIPPKYEQLNTLMKKLIHNLNYSWVDYHPIIQASLLHGEFVKIHPFIDGNGRTARLLLNFILMKNGYPPAIIKKEDRLSYYEALDYAHTTKDYGRFIKLILNLMVDASNLWITLI